MSRTMTAAEKQQYHGYFPQLDVNKAVVTGEASDVYNCIAYTVCVTSRWIWPGPTIAEFDKFYATAGYVRSSSGPIAVWGGSLSQMTHGCLNGSGIHGGRYESKCGHGLRIQHGLGELVSAAYGHVVGYYRPRSGTAAEFTDMKKRLSKMPKFRSTMSSRDTSAIRKETAQVPAATREEFERRYAAWRKTWSAPHLLIVSDPGVLRHSTEFAALTAMGPEIVPLVIAKLAQPDQFFALQLYDALQHDRLLRIETAADDEKMLEGEQGRAERVVRRWLSR